MAMTGEQRAGTRIQVEMNAVGCVLDTEGRMTPGAFRSVVLNIGMGGLRLRTDLKVFQGDLIRVLCRLEGRYAPLLNGRVVWSRPGAETIAGITFLPSPWRGEAALAEFCGLPVHA